MQMTKQIQLANWKQQEVEYGGLMFTVIELDGEYFMILSELMAYLKLRDKNKFLDSISYYCTDKNTLSILTPRTGAQIILRVDNVLRRVIKGNSTRMECLATWLFGVFCLKLNTESK